MCDRTRLTRRRRRQLCWRTCSAIVDSLESGKKRTGWSSSPRTIASTRLDDYVTNRVGDQPQFLFDQPQSLVTGRAGRQNRLTTAKRSAEPSGLRRTSAVVAGILADPANAVM